VLSSHGMPSNTQQNDRQQVKHSADVAKNERKQRRWFALYCNPLFARCTGWIQTSTAVCHVSRLVPAFVTTLCNTPKLCFSTESGQAGLAAELRRQ